MSPSQRDQNWLKLMFRAVYLQPSPSFNFSSRFLRPASKSFCQHSLVLRQPRTGMTSLDESNAVFYYCLEHFSAYRAQPIVPILQMPSFPRILAKFAFHRSVFMADVDHIGFYFGSCEKLRLRSSPGLKSYSILGSVLTHLSSLEGFLRMESFCWYNLKVSIRLVYLSCSVTIISIIQQHSLLSF
jgi:hypothetical protein